MKMPRLLLVEDDLSIAHSVKLNLELGDFEVHHAATAREARRDLDAGEFALLLLDVQLPDGNGIDLCGEFHESHPGLPIIMLTARKEEELVVKALSLGAVDYLRKPFGMEELRARVQRTLNRGIGPGAVLSLGALRLNKSEQTATISGKKLNLTKREFQILSVLLSRLDAVVSRDEILTQVDSEGEVLDATLSSHISRIRNKLKEASGETILIEPVYGMGYKIRKS